MAPPLVRAEMWVDQSTFPECHGVVTASQRSDYHRHWCRDNVLVVSFERRVGFVVGVALISGASAIGLTASCSHGNYDGSFDASALDGGQAAVGEDAAVVISRTVQPEMDTTVTTADTAFEITILKGTFTSPTTVEIKTLAERPLDNGLIVPTYAVAAGSEPPKLPVQVSFRGNANNTLLIPSLQKPDGTFGPLPVVGAGNQTNNGGPNPVQTNPWWGLTKTFGTFSLEHVAVAPKAAFYDYSNTGCTSCCASNGGPGGANATSYQGGCGCANPTDPNPGCFIKNCADLVASAARCVALDSTISQSLSCQTPACLKCMAMGGPGCSNCNFSGQTTCSPNQPCCVDKSNLGNPDMCLGSGASCRGLTVTCEQQADCKSGTTCCVVGQETLCVESCPAPQRVCTISGNECADAGVDAGDGGDAGACQASTYCPFGTCGAPPAACD